MRREKRRYLARLYLIYMDNEHLTGQRVVTVALLAITVLGVLGCVLLAVPFASALTWASALTILATPAHRRIAKWIPHPNRAAAVSCAAIGLALLVPALLIGTQAASEAAVGFEKLQKQTQEQGGWEKVAASSDPRVARVLSWARANINWDRELDRMKQAGQRYLAQWAGGTIWAAINTLLTLFLLFYFFRDRRQVLSVVRMLLPLSDRESTLVLARVEEMIRSTVYGTLVVSVVQGTLGGVMFFLLGLPGAVFWGLVMTVLSVIPVLGAFVVWVPAALFLMVQGAWWKAVILIVYGTLVVGTIDNLLYPILVGKDTRMHTVPVFIAIVGGLTLFGAAGLVLGPALLALTWALLEILRKRTDANDDAIDEPTPERRPLATSR